MNNIITLKEVYDILSRSPVFGKYYTKGQRRKAAIEYQLQFIQTSAEQQRGKEQIH